MLAKKRKINNGWLLVTGMEYVGEGLGGRSMWAWLGGRSMVGGAKGLAN